MDKETTNKNFSCDLNTGVCSPNDSSGIEEINLSTTPKVKLIYYTDPICSACWAIEPELKKFKLEYGDYVTIEYKMGGLLPSWEGFSDKGNGISKPSDVAQHWDEVGQHTQMSIDGDVWLEDPLDSSYPPSIAFKAVQLQSETLAIHFLRKIREQLFLEKKNITNEVLLANAVNDCGGNRDQFLKDYKNEVVKERFYQEVQAGRQMGVRGFPTFIFVGANGKGFRISGMAGYTNYILALEKALGKKVTAQKIDLDELGLLQKYGYLATKELMVILSQDKTTTAQHLHILEKQGKIKKEPQKYGDFWRFIQ